MPFNAAKIRSNVINFCIATKCDKHYFQAMQVVHTTVCSYIWRLIASEILSIPSQLRIGISSAQSIFALKASS